MTLTPTLTFTCSICGEPSLSICVYCTKDACTNHLCDRCRRCSDCCECDIQLDEHPELALVEAVDLTAFDDEEPVEADAPGVPVTQPEPSPAPLSAEQWTAAPEAEPVVEHTGANSSEPTGGPVTGS